MRETRRFATGLATAVALMAALAGTPVNAADEASLRIEPATVKAIEGAEFTVRVVQDAPVATSGAQASIDFDPSILQVVSVTPGAAYAKAPFIIPQDLEASATAANQGGHLAQIAAAFIPPDSVATGPAEFLVVRFRVVGCGETALELPVGPLDAQMIDGRAETYGAPVEVGTVAGSVTTCVAASEATPTEDAAPVAAPDNGSPAPLLLAGAGLLLVVTLVGGLAWRSRRRGQAA